MHAWIYKSIGQIATLDSNPSEDIVRSDLELEELCAESTNDLYENTTESDRARQMPEKTGTGVAEHESDTVETEASVSDAGTSKDSVLVDEEPGLDTDKSVQENAETQTEQNIESTSAPNDCCLWKTCKKCDDLKAEKAFIESKHMEEEKWKSKNDRNKNRRWSYLEESHEKLWCWNIRMESQESKW